MKTMPKSTKEEKLRWIRPILEVSVLIKNMAQVCPFSLRSLNYWLRSYRAYGPEGLENKSTRPKTNPKETPIRIKERIIELRKKRKQCSLKIQWDLKEEGIDVHYQTIKIKCDYVRIPLKKGELVEIDVKFVPERIGGRKYYQFTAIDCATRGP